MALIWLGNWCFGILAIHWLEDLNPHHELIFLHKAATSTLLFLIVLQISWRSIKRPLACRPALAS
jgi:cytochrome b561